MKVFDIGANIGYYTAYFSRRVDVSGLVVAIEPTSRGTRLLRANAALCETNVVALQAAIGAEPGYAHFIENKALDISTVRFGATKDKSSVEVITIDKLSNDYGNPDLIKIDVEGAELHALNGACKTLSSERPPIVMIEYDPANTQNFGGYDLNAILKFFPAQKYVVFRIATPGILLDLDCIHDAFTYDYLAVPRERLSEVNGLHV
jgi:FkbM family methyltransferase